MSHNNIDIDGANSIAEPVQAMPALKKLDVSYCNISDAGSLLISKSYTRSNKTLNELIMSLKNN